MEKSKKSSSKYFINFIKGSLTVLISVSIIYGVVHAGNLTPPVGDPSAQFYTLTDIYNRLTTNDTAVVGDHSFNFSDSLSSSGWTLTDIYNSIPTIDPTKVLLGTPYLGVDGTYNADNLSVGTIKKDTSFGVSSTGDYPSFTYPLPGDTLASDADAGHILSGFEAWNKAGILVTGAIPAQTLSPTSESLLAGYYNATTLSAVDADLAIGNIKSGINVFGLDGGLLPSGGDTTPSDVREGKTFFGDSQSNWILQTGTMPTRTLSADSDTVSAGYYEATNLSTVDTDLIAGNILSGKTIFGILGSASSGYAYGDSSQDYVLGTASGAGTALKNLFNGTDTAGNYPQSVGGVDDYNAGGAMPSDSYKKTWTACNEGNTYCGTGDATNADKKDNSTGLVWSKWLSSGSTKTWFWANNAKYPNGLPGDDGVCDTHNEVACKVVKLTDADPGGKTGCDALGCGWRLPYQKELMQAYIDGSWANLSSAGSYFWSATTVSNLTQFAWYTYLSNGRTYFNTKTNGASYTVRCVR